MIPPRYQPLFETIFRRSHPRNNIIAPTQDGKSLTIAAATTLVSSALPERFTILAPNEKKADIIMAYVREFATQHPIISTQLELDRNDTLDRLRRERSKKNITFKRGGGVQTLTLDARNGKRSIEAAMGFGSKNVIEDEAGLIEDPLHATVMRMLGGYDYDKSFLLKIGNPFYNNHFKRSSFNPKYNRIHLTYRDSSQDREAGFHGFDPLFIEEMRDEAFFDVFYECQFPPEDTIDADGYRQLLTSQEIRQGQVDRSLVKPTAKLGCDIAGGGDLNVYTLRNLDPHFAFVAGSNRSGDTMTNVTEIEKIVEEFGLEWSNVNLDDIGIGRGVSDRLKEKGYEVNGVSVGSASSNPARYSNLKAELYWELRKKVKDPAFFLEEHKGWEQLTWIRYKVNSDKQIKVEDKQSLKKRKGKSPDFAESLMLTFFEPPFVGFG
ncbi:MAG: hypothetical protein RLO51_11095 [Thalassobaculum sp.]|uniref:hypothetical protein n=1 Tax=Thalassobaculum sp. TaxID=2022740 RepID=UPI0032EFDC18